MGTACHLRDLAGLLPISGECTILRPEWKNPACEGGAGLEFVTDMSVEELILRWRERLIVCTYGAQFLVAYCKGDEGCFRQTQLLLGPNRNLSDMFFHTDETHRDNNVTIVLGESQIPTGVASKPLIAQACLDLLDTDGQLSSMKRFFAKNVLKLHPEAAGDSLLFDFATAKYLYSLYVHSEDGPLSEREHLWRDVQALNVLPEIVWIGKMRERYRDRTQAIFLCQAVYHCKGYTDQHHLPRDGDKRRFTLKMPSTMQKEIIPRLADVTHNDRGAFDNEWPFSILGPKQSRRKTPA